MEDYDTFVKHHLSVRRREEEEQKPSSSPSLISFYGRPILPPLLSGEQREEMQRYRDAAQRAAVQRRAKDDPRLAYVQNILHSVQLRKTPTLEELLQESEINIISSHQHKTCDGSASQSYFTGTDDGVLLSLTHNRKENESALNPPFTSTTYSAFLATNTTPQKEGCLMDPHYSQHGSQPSSFSGVSHRSSGYVTYENVENTTSVSEGIDAGRESMGGFFLHSTTNTIAKMPDIISYPPIDGEELERSGLESSFCKDFEDDQEVCRATLWEDSVISEKSESSTEGEADLSVTTILDRKKDQNLDESKGQVSVSENSDFSDNPESSQTLSARLSPTTEIQPDRTDSEQTDTQEDEEKPSEEPYRLSLQALLKKSQEYRRRQRMLRNQAKISKTQERTREQPRVRAEEQSLSDKENDEFPRKGGSSAEGRKSKERRGALNQSVEMSPKKSWDNEEGVGWELFEERTDLRAVITTLAGDENTKEVTDVDEKTMLRSNRQNVSQEVTTELKQISVLAQQQQQLSPPREAFCLTISSSNFSNKGGKYQTIPAPNFCKSPVRKSKGGVLDEEAVNGKNISKVGIGLSENHSVVEGNPGQQNVHPALSSKDNPGDEEALARVSLRSSQHIDQLESHLSGLKILISDLESTLTENFRNQSLSESKRAQSYDDDSNDAEQDQRELLGGQSLDSLLQVPSVVYTDDVPALEEEEVDLSELRLVKTLVTERGKDRSSFKEGLTKSSGPNGSFRKQHPAPKCLLSVTQRQRIPDIFRNVSSEAEDPRNASVLSDTSNRPVQRRHKEEEEGCSNSTRSPSLNQSYDVEAPSDLWLQEGVGSRSDGGSEGHPDMEKHLTPESEGEGQGGGSKVKRRLLMHTTEDTPRRGADDVGGAGSAVRPSSSTPRAAVRWSEGLCSLKDKQEQLREAHAAQVRALQEEHRRQQEELLQALAARFHLLQSVSFPCSVSSSRLGDTLTLTSLSQPASTISERCRPLLSAAVRGFLTRRLLRTEKVAQLVRTVRDTRQLLQTLQLQQQSPGRGELSNRQDLLLQERVALQLRSARYEVSDIFFSLSAAERMQLISWDRELVRERDLRRQSGHTGRPAGKSSLSAATQKSLERKREMLLQKKAAGRNRGVVMRTRHSPGPSAEQPLETKRGQFKANPQRVPKTTSSSRPR